MSSLAKVTRSHAEALLGRIHDKKDEIARAFYDIGVALAELHEKKLYGPLGYATFDAMLEDREMMTGQYARKLIQVSKSFDRAQAKRLGPEKAYALVRYVANTKQADDPAEYLLEGFPVPGGKRQPIDEVTVRQIAEATRLAVLRQKGQHSESERARRDAASAARKVAAKVHAKTDGEGSVNHVFKHGSWWLEITIPAEMAGIVRF